MIMKSPISIVMTCVALLVFIAGCDQRSLTIPTDPTAVTTSAADRVLAFRYSTATSQGATYFIALYETVPAKDTPQDTVVEVAIDDSLFTMTYMNFPPYLSGWFSLTPHLITGEPRVKLYIDEQEKLNTIVKPVNKPSVAFPVSYDYQQPLYLNWAVNPGNQYQFVRAESWPVDIVGNFSPYSKYVRQLAANVRSHRFPANCVTVAGTLENTVFGLIVQQVNYKVVGKTAVMVYQEEGSSYQGSGTRLENDLTRDAALEIHEQLSGR
jgi:hypothetical protein